MVATAAFCYHRGMSAQRPKVFISYAQPDAEWARSLESRLSQAGVDVWNPMRHILPGDNWALEIGRALDQADVMVILVSPAAARSKEVRDELKYAMGSERFENRVIPIEIEPTDEAPWVLRHFQWVKGSPDEAGQRIADILTSQAS